jgi:hypothetical protein
MTIEHDIDASIRALNAARLAVDAHASSGTGAAMLGEIASALGRPGHGPLAYAVADAIRTLGQAPAAPQPEIPRTHFLEGLT